MRVEEGWGRRWRRRRGVISADHPYHREGERETKTGEQSVAGDGGVHMIEVTRVFFSFSLFL